MPKPREKPCVTLRCMLFALLWSWIGVVFVALRHMGPASGSSESWESATASLAAAREELAAARELLEALPLAPRQGDSGSEKVQQNRMIL